MSTVLEERNPPPATLRGWWAGALLLVALGALYVPTFVDLARGPWRDEAHAHGPLILAVCAALFWRGRAALLDARTRPAPVAGAALAAFGLILWLLGRTQSLVLFEAASLIPVLAGAILVVAGTGAVRRLAFPLAFLAFYVPLPGFVVDGATAPLKELVSAAVAPLLAMLGYAVERTGVILTVEGREMLVADACSGLNSIVSLAAMSLLYAHLRGASAARAALLVLAVVPIAVAANIVRVLALVLLTLHAGPDVAQGWAHDALGLAVFVLALLMLVALDRMLPRRVVSDTRKTGTRDAAGTYPEPGYGKAGYVPAASLAVAMVAVALAAPALKPVADPAAAAFDLEAAVPVAFGGWRIDPHEAPVAPAPEVDASLARLYRQVVGRTYVNAAGETMMLTVAHGGDQSDALKAHRQEVCYRAQGFEVGAIARDAIAAGERRIPVTRFLAVRGERIEPVTYWFTMGDRVVLGRLERLREQIAHGLRGRVPDGLLVRVSSIDTDPARAHAAQRTFVAALLAAASPDQATRLAGATR